jgi:hypothetical protein
MICQRQSSNCRKEDYLSPPTRQAQDREGKLLLVL